MSFSHDLSARETKAYGILQSRGFWERDLETVTFSDKVQNTGHFSVQVILLGWHCSFVEKPHLFNWSFWSLRSLSKALTVLEEEVVYSLIRWQSKPSGLTGPGWVTFRFRSKRHHRMRRKGFRLSLEWKKPKEDESLDVGSADFLWTLSHPAGNCLVLIQMCCTWSRLQPSCQSHPSQPSPVQH